MRRVLDVFLGETALQVGTLRFEIQGARQSAGFEYHPEWLGAEDRFALEPGLPLVSGMQYHQQIRDGSLFQRVSSNCLIAGLTDRFRPTRDVRRLHIPDFY